MKQIKHSLKETLTIMLTAAIVIANAMPVMATDVGEGVGTINAEPKDIISVNVPTSPNFNFDIDPSKMLYGSSSETYAEKTLLFANADGKYSDKTDVISISSNSTVELTVYMTGKLTNTGTGAGEVKQVATTAAAEEAGDPSIAILISECNQDGVTLGGATPVALTAEGGTVSSNLASWVDNYDKVKVASENGGLIGNGTDGYIQKWEYIESSTTTAPVPKYFVLEGSVTPTAQASWSSITKIPKLKVTYVIKKGDAEVKNSGTATYSVSTSSKSVVITDAPADALSKVELCQANGTVAGTMKENTHYTYVAASKKFDVLRDTCLASDYQGGKFKLTFDDGTVIDVEIVAP